MTTCMMDSCSVTNNSTEARATRDKNNVETNNLTNEPNENTVLGSSPTCHSAYLKTFHLLDNLVQLALRGLVPLLGLFVLVLPLITLLLGTLDLALQLLSAHICMSKPAI